ncbi:MAG: Beta-xylosidase [Lentisphaerae bacterium ADurb.Bin242]|nr:MAG: Beta-xylosidase [Lentisphaerae bacterium ADurb.Bin242]
MDRLKKVGEVRRFSSSQVKASRIGIGFEKLDRGVFDPEKAYDPVAELGVKWVRIQSGWARTEKAKGVYDFAWLDSIVDNLCRRGLQPWICLCYGNGLYDADAARVFGAVGCPPIKNEEQKKAWHSYVAALTARYRGKVRWYEVWNEPDGRWCWKHGPSGTEYGEFVKATAAAVRKGDPSAKVIGGSQCIRDLKWLNEVFSTGAASVMDAYTYHSYDPDETEGFKIIPALRALCHAYNPKLQIIQGETGAQSRNDGCGAMAKAAWTPLRQAKFLVRHTISDLLEGVMFSSYFSSMDMMEALNGTVGNKASYMDFGYFGVLSAEFDENGVATGGYAPKLSYRSLQSIASVFREEFTVSELPIRFWSEESKRILRRDESGRELLCGGFRKPNGSAAFTWWKPVELLTTSFESTVSLQTAALPGEIRLIDLLEGVLYALPEEMIEDDGKGFRRLANIPVRDYPLLLAFGEFA